MTIGLNCNMEIPPFFILAASWPRGRIGNGGSPPIRRREGRPSPGTSRQGNHLPVRGGPQNHRTHPGIMRQTHHQMQDTQEATRGICKSFHILLTPSNISFAAQLLKIIYCYWIICRCSTTIFVLDGFDSQIGVENWSVLCSVVKGTLPYYKIMQTAIWCHKTVYTDSSQSVMSQNQAIALCLQTYSLSFCLHPTGGERKPEPGQVPQRTARLGRLRGACRACRDTGQQVPSQATQPSHHIDPRFLGTAWFRFFRFGWVSGPQCWLW